MIAGRLHWKRAGAAIPKGSGLAALDFAAGTLILTEAGTKRRASLHLLRGEGSLSALDPGGIDVLTSTPAEFAASAAAEESNAQAGPHRPERAERHR